MSSPKHKRLAPLRRPRAILVLLTSLALSAVVVSMSAPSPALVAGPELVVNGAFDDGTVGWRTNDARNSTLTVVSDDGDGPYASLTSGSTRTVVLNDRVNTVARTTEGTRYRVSASVRGSQPKVSGQLRVREVAGKDVTVHRSTFYLTDTGWTTVELEFETVSDGGSLDLNVLAWKNAAGRALEIDDVSMVELLEPGTDPTPTTRPTTPAPTATTPTASPTRPAPTPSPSATPTPTPSPTTPTASPSPTATPTPTTPPTAGVLSNGCRYSARGIPACGAYFGAAVGGNADPTSFERSVGGTLGIRRTYWSPTQVDGAVKTAAADLEAGRLPWISFKLPHSWAEMAQGAGDAWARDIAQRLDELDGPVWLAFHHEPEGDGPIAEWTRLQQRLAPIVRAEADNVAYTIVLTGWNQLYGAPEYALDALWPKGVKVDVAGFDVYNFYGSTKDGPVRLEPTDMKAYFKEFAAWSKATGVKWGLAETGFTDMASVDHPAWISGTYDALVDAGGIAFTYFNSPLNSSSSWVITTAQKQGAFAAVLKRSPRLPAGG